MKYIIILSILSFSAFSYGATDEYDKFFDDMIREQEKEVQELKEMKDSFLKRGSQEKHAIRDEIHRLQTELRRDFQMVSDKIKGVSVSTLEPRIEMKESSAGYDVKAEVPGLSEKDVKVAVQGNDLVISAKKEEKIESESAGKKISEFEYGEFRRQIHFAKKVDPKSLKVEFGKGLVNVHLNKMGKS